MKAVGQRNEIQAEMPGSLLHVSRPSPSTGTNAKAQRRDGAIFYHLVKVDN